MRFLVTRPEPDAAGTAAWLRAAGHQAMVQPMLRVVFVPPPPGLPEPGALIATSRNGIRALSAWPDAAGWRAKPLFVTGSGTAEAAREAGFGDIRSGGEDGGALARRLVAELPPASGPVIHAAGRDRSGGLAAPLAAAGHDLVVVEAYRAEPVEALAPDVAAALARRQIDGVLVFSRRTAAAFAAALAAAGLEDALAGVAVYAISARAAEPLAGLVRLMRVAAHPDFDGIAAMIPPAGPELA